MQSAAPVTKWSAGSIRITSRTVTAGEISGRLGIMADQQFERDSLVSRRNPISARRESSVWLRRSGLPDDSDLTDHVRALVELVDGHREKLAALSADCDLELWLGFGSENGQGGCVLPARLLAEVGALGLDIVLDLYPPEPTTTDAPDKDWTAISGGQASASPVPVGQPSTRSGRYWIFLSRRFTARVIWPRSAAARLPRLRLTSGQTPSYGLRSEGWMGNWKTVSHSAFAAMNSRMLAVRGSRMSSLTSPTGPPGWMRARTIRLRKSRQPKPFGSSLRPRYSRIAGWSRRWAGVRGELEGVAPGRAVRRWLQRPWRLGCSASVTRTGCRPLPSPGFGGCCRLAIASWAVIAGLSITEPAYHG